MRFLAVNREDGVDSAGEAVEGRTLPFLQDTVEVDAWGSWQVEWRDIVILDANNEVVGVMNLTDYDLEVQENVELLRELVAEAQAR